MKARDWLADLHKVCHFISIEVDPKAEKREVKLASRSELQRWLQQGSILINGERVAPDEEMDFPIISVVLFPKSPTRRCTLW